MLLAYPTFLPRPADRGRRYPSRLAADGQLKGVRRSRVHPPDLQGGNALDGLDEIRGEFLDVGRMKPDDPQIQHLRPAHGVPRRSGRPRGRGPGDVTAIIATAVAPATLPAATATPTIRSIVLQAIALSPSRRVTITGQYSGRNLLGDVPDAARPRAATTSCCGRRMPPSGSRTCVRRSRTRTVRNSSWALDFAGSIRGAGCRLKGTIQQGRGLLWLDGRSRHADPSRKPPTQPVATEDEAGPRARGGRRPP